jgi:hypothetical protein
MRTILTIVPNIRSRWACLVYQAEEREQIALQRQERYHQERQQANDAMAQVRRNRRRRTSKRWWWRRCWCCCCCCYYYYCVLLNCRRMDGHHTPLSSLLRSHVQALREEVEDVTRTRQALAHELEQAVVGQVRVIRLCLDMHRLLTD